MKSTFFFLFVFYDSILRLVHAYIYNSTQSHRKHNILKKIIRKKKLRENKMMVDFNWMSCIEMSVVQRCT